MFDFKGKRVFITGGTGFVGSHLTQRLKDLGADIRLLTHVRPSKIVRGITGIRADIADEASHFVMRAYLEWFQPEIIFHLAAQPIVCDVNTDEIETMRTNIDGTVNILSACKGLPNLKSFVHISTDKVFGCTNPITKRSLLSGLQHPYNASKMIGDQIAQFYSNYFDIPVVIIRNANVYGEGDLHFDRIVPRTIRFVARGERPTIRGDGKNTRDYLYVEDLVNGYLAASQLPYQNKLTTVNLGGFNHSVLDVVDAILGKMGRVDLSPNFEKQWKGEIPDQHIENDAAKELIGWNPQTTLDCGLDKTIPFYVEHLTNG